MRPTKNHIFCVASKRPKVLFNSKVEADRFIFYNKDEISKNGNKAPIRSYYCRVCGGWHVTSCLSEKTIARSERRDEQIVAEADRYVKIFENVDSVIEEVHKQGEEAKATILQGRLISTELSLKQCLDMLAPLRTNKGITRKEWMKQNCVINDQLRRIGRIKDLGNLPEEEREVILSKEGKTKSDEEICTAYLNNQTLKKMESLLDEADEDIRNDDKKMAREKLCECRRLLKEIVSCPSKKHLIKSYKRRIEEKYNSVQASLMPEEVKKEKHVFTSNSLEYREAILYLIEKIGALQSAYKAGDMDGCENQLEIIAYGLDELPEDPNTTVLRQQYEYWCNLLVSSS